MLQWGIVEVSNWLEFIGLFQYRRAFRQQCIDGATLVELTDAQMRVRAHPLPDKRAFLVVSEPRHCNSNVRLHSHVYACDFQQSHA